jgi:hypothetical protein
MILGLISIILGIFILIILWPFSLNSFSSVATIVVLLSLIGFGGRIFYVDFNKFKKERKLVNDYLKTTNQLLASKDIPFYPSYEILKHNKIIKKVTELINTRNIENAKPILNNQTSFQGAKLKFLFFSWIFKENDDYRIYKTWKKIYKHVDKATQKTISDLLDDIKQGEMLVDITQAKSDVLSPGSYLLKKENELWTLVKIPIHTRYINDDFYGTMIYDHKMDQPNYTFKTEDIVTKRKQHIKQTTRFFLDIKGNPYKKEDKKEIKSLSLKLKNEDEFDLLSYELPF